MAEPTHLIDSSSSETYISPDRDPYYFERKLRVFDSKNTYALSLCKLPHPGWANDFSESELYAARSTYIQAAGSADAMTVEVRRQFRGESKQLVIGRLPASDHRAPPDIIIQIGQNSTSVYENEVFDFHAAAAAFFSYYSNGELSDNDYTFREIRI